jgi:cobalamin biosynthetic protein CobC
MFPGAPEPFIDLSTGINPHPWPHPRPLPALPSEIFSRLPDRASIRQLATVAAKAYGAPSAEHVVPAPGTQMLLPQVAGLVKPGKALILRTTYAEHKRAAQLAGHAPTEASDVGRLRGADFAIVVNPNNPDGRIVEKRALMSLADSLHQHGGILVVDESFADVAPDISLAGETNRDNIVVLRSFGKFYGLAGLRLASPTVSARRSGPGPSPVRRSRSARRRSRTTSGSAERLSASPLTPSDSTRCSPKRTWKLSAARRFTG